MLSWIVNAYSGPELLGSPDLGLTPEQIPSDLLDSEGLSKLTKDYLAVSLPPFMQSKVSICISL